MAARPLVKQLTIATTEYAADVAKLINDQSVDGTAVLCMRGADIMGELVGCLAQFQKTTASGNLLFNARVELDLKKAAFVADLLHKLLDHCAANFGSSEAVGKVTEEHARVLSDKVGSLIDMASLGVTVSLVEALSKTFEIDTIVATTFDPIQNVIDGSRKLLAAVMNAATQKALDDFTETLLTGQLQWMGVCKSMNVARDAIFTPFDVDHLNVDQLYKDASKASLVDSFSKHVRTEAKMLRLRSILEMGNAKTSAKHAVQVSALICDAQVKYFSGVKIRARQVSDGCAAEQCWKAAVTKGAGQQVIVASVLVKALLELQKGLAELRGHALEEHPAKVVESGVVASQVLVESLVRHWRAALEAASSEAIACFPQGEWADKAVHGTDEAYVKEIFQNNPLHIRLAHVTEWLAANAHAVTQACVSMKAGGGGGMQTERIVSTIANAKSIIVAAAVYRCLQGAVAHGAERRQVVADLEASLKKGGVSLSEWLRESLGRFAAVAVVG